MTNLIAAFLISAPFVVLPVVSGWVSRRPLTDLDRRLSDLDIELDALS